MSFGCLASIFGSIKSPMKITDEIILNGSDGQGLIGLSYENVQQQTPKKLEINMESEPENKQKLVSIEFEDELNVIPETQDMPTTSNHIPTLGDYEYFPGITSKSTYSLENHSGSNGKIIAPDYSCFLDGLLSNQFNFPTTEAGKIDEKPKFEIKPTVRRTEYKIEFCPQNQIPASAPVKIYTKESVFGELGAPCPKDYQHDVVWGSRNAKSENRPREPQQPFHTLFSTATDRPRRNATSTIKDYVSQLADEPTPKRRRSARLHEEPAPEVPADCQELYKKYGYRYRRSDNEKLGVLKISGRDLSFLSGRQFLNDIIIDQYLNLICKRSEENKDFKKCAALCVFFYSAVENGHNYLAFFPKNLFENELLFIPMNADSHWYLYVADFVNLTLYGYDSIGEFDLKGETRKKILQTMKEYAIMHNHDIDFDKWDDSPPSELQKGPLQINGHDCGVYVLQYADRLTRNVPTMMTDNQMSNYRKRMIYELLEGKLLPPSPI